MWLSESEMVPGDTELILHHVTREEWRAMPPRGRHRPRHPFKLILDHFTYTEPCYSYKQCMREVQEMQRLHIEEGFSDIKYHFLIGGDGNVYEGRGWGLCSSRALRTFVKLWRRRLDIAFIGDFTDKKIPDIMETRFEHIITYGVHFNLIRRSCNTLHIRKDIDLLPLECEVIKTTRKKPPRSERPRKKKKKKPKESSDLSFHSNTDLNTNATDSPDTSDIQIPYTTTYSDTSYNPNKSESLQGYESTDSSDALPMYNLPKKRHIPDTYDTSDTSESSKISEETGASENEEGEKYDPSKELNNILDKAVRRNENEKEPMELFVN